MIFLIAFLLVVIIFVLLFGADGWLIIWDAVCFLACIGFAVCCMAILGITLISIFG